MMRSIAYIRYFNTATAIHAGNAATPSADDVVARRNRNQDAGDADDGAGAQPLELLTALAASTPVGEYLQHQPGDPARQEGDHQAAAENQQRGWHGVNEVAARVDADRLSGGGRIETGRQDQPEHHRSDDESRRHSAQASGRQAAVGKHPQEDRDEDDEYRPGVGEPYCHPAKRQCPVMDSVVKDEVLTDGSGSEQEDREHDPPDGIARTPDSEEGAHRRHRHQRSSAREPLRRGPTECCLMDKAVKRHPGYAHAERKHAERDRRDRRHLPRSQGGNHRMPHSSADRAVMS
jgi:hypothetical protein